MSKKQTPQFSSDFLFTAVVALGIISLAASFMLGYQFGQGEDVSATPTTTVAQAAPAPTQAAQPSLPAPPEVPKSATPEVELFVMSECPFGLQMEKAMIPVANLLGDKADIDVKWVSYAMHEMSEIEENTRQYCIQEEQEDKYWEYLECYVQSTNGEACQQQVGIDAAMLERCVASANEEFGIMDSYEDQSSWLSGRFPQYNVHKDLNEQYGVQGSPTLVINGEAVQVSRSAETVKQAICNAFDNPPAECEQKLNMNAEQAGPGPLGVGTAPSAAGTPGCGV